jgi:hypothetical protein
MSVLERQATYNGALGARAMHSLGTYGQEIPVYDGEARTFTSTYYGGMLKIYTTHVAPPESADHPAAFYKTQVGSWSLTGNIEQFRSAATSYRNAADLARFYRNEAIKSANEKVKSILATAATSFATEVSVKNETYTVEATEDSEMSHEALYTKRNQESDT